MQPKKNIKNLSLPFFALFVLLFSCTAQDNTDWQIKTATMAAPEGSREGVKVLGFDSEGAMITLREGTNEMTCVADDPTKEGFSAAAYHKDLEAFMIRGRELRAEGKDRQGIFDARAAEIESGQLKIAQGSILYILTDKYDMEADSLNDRYLRYVVYMPFATSESTGLPLKVNCSWQPMANGSGYA